MGRSADFDKKTKEELERRVNGRCSNPACRRPTSGPMVKKDGVINIGKAAHICAASPGGKRYDPSMTDVERKDIENGIWLCSSCHDLVDSDAERFPVELLRKWKQDAEAKSLKRLSEPYSNLRKAKTDRKINKKKLIVCAMLLLLLVTIGCLLIHKTNRKKQYNEYMSQATFRIENRNMLEAADCFYQAYQSAYNDQTRLEALYHRGMCYYVYGLQNPQEMDLYLHSALDIYLTIITKFEETDSQWYIDAISDSCSIFYYLRYPPEHAVWYNLVRRLESQYHPDDLDKMKDIPIELAVKIALTCAQYYDIASEETLKISGPGKEYQKSMVYYGNAYYLGLQQNESVLQDAYDGAEVIMFLKEYANRMLNYYCAGSITNGNGDTEQALEKAQEVIALCEDALSSRFIEVGSYDYVELNTIMGKAWYVSGLQLMLAKDLLQASHDVLMPLVRLQISEEYQESFFPDSAFYAMLTQCCDDQDFLNIILLYEMAFARERKQGDNDRLVTLMISACTACSAVMEYGYYSPELADFALRTAEELQHQWSSELTEGDWAQIKKITERVR